LCEAFGSCFRLGLYLCVINREVERDSGSVVRSVGDSFRNRRTTR